jgi:UDP-glucuronate 4-epimerase
VSDIVDGTVRALERTEGYRVYNLGESETITVLELIELIGEALGRDPKIRFLPQEAGDVPATWADVTRAREELGYEPSVPIGEGIREFADWYRAERADAGPAEETTRGSRMTS